MKREQIHELISEYNNEDIKIGVLGSHSALEMGHGAKQEGFEVVVVCQKGREETYTKHYRNLFDHVILLDKFSDIIHQENLEELQRLNTIFIPNRSFSVYTGYDNIEQKFKVPLLGNRDMLRSEERNVPRNQYDLIVQAGLNLPKIFSSPEEIDRLAIVKVSEKTRSIERAFFYASSPKEFQKRSEERIKRGIINRKDLEEAIIEEYIVGAKFNANYFWSPIKEEIDLLGFDRRIQTNLDGVLDLPADEQLEAKLSTQNVEIGHMGATMRESQIEKILIAGEKFVETCKNEYPPGIIGLFALQGAMNKDLEFYIFDVSPRIPGCPCVEPTSPYMKYKYGKAVGLGRRVAMEIKMAIEENKLRMIVT